MLALVSSVVPEFVVVLVPLTPVVPDCCSYFPELVVVPLLGRECAAAAAAAVERAQVTLSGNTVAVATVP